MNKSSIIFKNLASGKNKIVLKHCDRFLSIGKDESIKETTLRRGVEEIIEVDKNDLIINVNLKFKDTSPNKKELARKYGY